MLLSGAMNQTQAPQNTLNASGAVANATPADSSSSSSSSLSENKARIAQLTAMIQARLSSKPTLLTNW